MNYSLKNPRDLAAAVVVVSAGALAAAYISQYVFGLDPCQLCFYQRKPYLMNILFGITALGLAPRSREAAVAVLFFCAGTFFIDSLIAGFHVGVEQHWWKGLESCSNYAMPEHASIEEMKKFIAGRNVVRCDVPAFVLFGISMAGYNFILATAMGFLTLVNAWRAKK